jgi:hypothetical protein
MINYEEWIQEVVKSITTIENENYPFGTCRICGQTMLNMGEHSSDCAFIILKRKITEFEIAHREILNNSLRPCRYCEDGGKPTILDSPAPNALFKIICNECYVSTDIHIYREDVIKYWNHLMR